MRVCESGVSVYGLIMCVRALVDAEGKVRCLNEPGSQQSFLFGEGPPETLGRVAAAHVRSEYLFCSYLTRWK